MAKARTQDGALAKIRKICAALSSTTEGAHHDAIGFKAGGKLFATYRAQGSLLVFGLQPDHLDALVESDSRFERYPRARGAVQVDCSKVTDWGQIRDFLEESHGMVAKPAAKRRAKR